MFLNRDCVVPGRFHIKVSAVSLLAVFLASCTTIQLNQNCTALQAKHLSAMAAKARAALDENRRRLNEVEAQKAQRGCAENLYSIIILAEECGPLRQQSRILQQNIAGLQEWLHEAKAAQNSVASQGKYISYCKADALPFSTGAVRSTKVMSQRKISTDEKTERFIARTSSVARADDALHGKQRVLQSVHHTEPGDRDETRAQLAQTPAQTVKDMPATAIHAEDAAAYANLPNKPVPLPAEHPMLSKDGASVEENRSMPSEDALLHDAAVKSEEKTVQLRPTLPPVQQAEERPLDDQEDIRIIGPSFFPDEPVTHPQ